MLVESNFPSFRKSTKKARGCIAYGFLGDHQDIVNSSGPVRGVVRTKRLLVLSLSLIISQLHDTVGSRRCKGIIIRHEHFILYIFKGVIE